MSMYDIIIIGGGVSGAAAARELSRLDAKILLLEKEEDVCCGTSKANSGIVHAGYDAAPGSLKAKLNVRGNALMKELSKELDFPFEQRGSLVICRLEDEVQKLEELYERGLENGVPDLRILGREEVLAMEPNLSDDVCAALYAPTAGIVCPFGLNIALAENAAVNGVEFRFETSVQKIRKIDGGYELLTDRGSFRSRAVVNAAGVYADCIHHMVSETRLHITPRRGDYCLFDKSAGAHVTRTVFALPGKMGKGILVTPTVHGNLLAGPTAIDVTDREGTNTTQEGLEKVLSKAGENVKNLPLNRIITSFAGLRAAEDGHDFIIGEAEDAPMFFDCAGIESPGLTCAPAIGEMIAGLLEDKMKLRRKENFIPTRKGILDPRTLSMEERNELIKKEPAYGTIVCRCESVSEGEILDAVRRPLGARSLDGVKRRTRAGMGRCQSGFCSPKVMEILARELGVSMTEITKSGTGSELVIGADDEKI